MAYIPPRLPEVILFLYILHGSTSPPLKLSPCQQPLSHYNVKKIVLDPCPTRADHKLGTAGPLYKVMVVTPVKDTKVPSIS
ncbi:hypothetical protein V6N13_087296 [Hibiscus sabdariffa]